MTGVPPEVEVEVAELALQRLVAAAVVTTPGVSRLHPQLSGVLAAAGRQLGRRVGGPDVPESPADPSAVLVERGDGGVTVSVRVIASLTRPVIETARDLHRRLRSELREHAALDADILVLIVDVDPGPA